MCISSHATRSNLLVSHVRDDLWFGQKHVDVPSTLAGGQSAVHEGLGQMKVGGLQRLALLDGGSGDIPAVRDKTKALNSDLIISHQISPVCS